MPRIFVEYLDLSCVSVAFGAAFCQIFLISRMKRDIIRDRHVRPYLATDLFNEWKVIRQWNLLRDWKLLRLHKSVFPASRQRQLLFVLQALMFLALFVYMFQDQILLDLIRTGR